MEGTVAERGARTPSRRVVGARGWRRSTLSALLATATLGVLVGQAQAQVSIEAEQITVTGASAGAVIVRNPFRLAFTEGAGHTVLTEVAGAQQTAGGQLYGALGFRVGAAEVSTYTHGGFAGNLLSTGESGAQYHAIAVVEASPLGEGVRLILSTDDPSGRKLTVDVIPQGGAAIRVSARPSDATGVAAMSDSFQSVAGEAFHGFGGRHNALDQHGQSFVNWVDQENVGTPESELAGPTNLYPNGPQAAYYVQSSFLSSQGYGFMLARNELSQWRLDSELPNAWQTEVLAPAIDYLVAPSGQSQAIAALTAVGGRQRVPPAWALGPTYDREVPATGAAAGEYEAQVRADLRHFQLASLPVSAYRLEGWSLLSPQALAGLIARLRGAGIHPLVYFRAFVGRERVGTESPAAFDQAVQGGYVATDAQGQPYLFEDNFGASAAVIDFTKASAVAWWRGRIEAALNTGADGFMLDFGEQVQPGMRFSDGSTGLQMHNRYPVLYEQVTRAVVEAWEAAHPGRTIFFYTRSGYSGQPGSPAYEGGNFPGDETPDWTQSSGLASLSRDMLNRGVGGAFGYSTDIGGYYDFYPSVAKPTTRELFLRWAAWSALTPFFRLHGALIGGVHDPWTFAPHTSQLYKELGLLHSSAIPLITSLWKIAEATGLPIARPLYLEYPSDAAAALQDQEWTLGPDVLVAPIIEEGMSTRSVYFPSGCWHSPSSGQQVSGPAAVAVSAQQGDLPFFFRCGTLPFRPPARFAAHLRS